MALLLLRDAGPDSDCPKDPAGRTILFEIGREPASSISAFLPRWQPRPPLKGFPGAGPPLGFSNYRVLLGTDASKTIALPRLKERNPLDNVSVIAGRKLRQADWLQGSGIHAYCLSLCNCAHSAVQNQRRRNNSPCNS
jgi:hypothetical protein